MNGLASFSADERIAYQLGVRHFERGETDAAIDQLTRLVATRPLFADVHYLLGLCYTKMNREDEARKIFQVILENYRGTDVAEAAADLVPDAQ